MWYIVIDCIFEINSTQVNNVKDINVVLGMYNLMEYSNNYSKHEKFYGHTTEINNFRLLMELLLNLLLLIITASFKFKQKTTCKIVDGGNIKIFK